MGLSSELISQFVKITNDSKEKPKESTVYGTVKSSDGNLLVQLDGSSLLTPVISTANMKDGDRVTVMIKNHSAIVTGNVSSPSASSDALKDLSEDLGLIGGDLEGITNDFDLLVKTVETINDDLNTAESNISGLADNVKKNYLPLSGGVMKGDLTTKTLLSEILSGASKAGRIHILPVIPYESIDPTHSTDVYLRELLKWTCARYSDTSRASLFIGIAVPNSAGPILFHIYDTSIVKDGLPEYSIGAFINLDQKISLFGTSSYTFKYRQI